MVSKREHAQKNGRQELEDPQKSEPAETNINKLTAEKLSPVSVSEQRSEGEKINTMTKKELIGFATITAFALAYMV